MFHHLYYDVITAEDQNVESEEASDSFCDLVVSSYIKKCVSLVSVLFFGLYS